MLAQIVHTSGQSRRDRRTLSLADLGLSSTTGGHVEQKEQVGTLQGAATGSGQRAQSTHVSWAFTGVAGIIPPQAPSRAVWFPSLVAGGLTASE